MPTGPDLDRLAELEEERRFLLRSLEDLERERAAGDVDEADYLELKDGYTARAAAVLRAIEDGRLALPEPAARRPAVRAVAAVAVVAVLASGSGLLVARSSGQRTAGETFAGSIEETAAQKLERARTLLDQPLEAIELYQEVLDTDPDNPEALTYQGWLFLLAGRDREERLVERAGQQLDRAVAVDPAYPDARFFRAFLNAEVRGDREAALADLDAFFANDPPAGMIEQVRQFQASLEAGGG